MCSLIPSYVVISHWAAKLHHTPLSLPFLQKNRERKYDEKKLMGISKHKENTHQLLSKAKETQCTEINVI